jgi:DNA-binding transcriptional regulator YiaG
MHEIEAVKIPDADAIKALRAQINCTQAKCAKMAQVSLVTWKQWEGGTRRPSKPSWGMFLLAIDKHPDFFIVSRGDGDEKRKGSNYFYPS